MVAEQEPERSGLGQVITLPQFDLPFPRKIHPHADSIIAHTCQWALATGLRPDENGVEKLRRGGIMHAGPRLVPGAPMDVACLVNDWTVWLIVLDDEVDEGELGKRPELTRLAIADVIAAFGGQARGPAARLPHLEGISEAAADLGRRFEAQAPSPAWLARFRRDATAHIWSKVDEAKHRASDDSLNVGSYVALRRVTSAAYTYAEIAEIAAQAAIPERVQESPAWKQMLDAAADVWLGIQDICSCAKEVTTGDDLNLAAVMARSAGTLERGREIQRGIDAAYQWVCRRAENFADQRAQLAAIPVGLDGDPGTAVTRCLRALEELLGGHTAWNSDKNNPRYPQAIPLT